MKINGKIFLISILIIIKLFIQVKSDLPVHCLKSQIVGKWKIFATELTKVNKDDLYKFTCKHAIPTHENNAYLVKPDSSFKKVIFVELKLNDQSVIQINDNTIKGNWTMVYNEGFDILADNYSFFTFSKYSPDNNLNKKNWKSKCYSTLIGFYHKDNNQRGCFYAEKLGEDPDKITNNDVKDKLHVVEGTVKTLNKIRFKEDSLFYNVNFLQAKEKETLVLDAKFKDHSKVVEMINSMKDSMWEADNYEEYSNLTIEDLNNLAGRKRHNHKSMFSEKRRNKSKNKMKSLFDEAIINSLKFSNSEERDSSYPEFPKNYFENMKHMNAAKNQGNCGSCFAVASINMLEARLSRKYNIKENLSVQHILSCSVYNQACDGGYAYLALKFGNEINLVPESCFPTEVKTINIKNITGDCNKRCDINKLDTTYKVSDYYYLGGSYGKCSEFLIMKEIYEKGPVVISFEPDYTFMLFKRGIYSSPKKSWIDNKISTKPEWQKVDHSVTAVGWGYDEEKKVKYWLLQNSWGKRWGDNGYFKMLRGTDHMGIESICEAGNAMPIKH